MIGSILAVLAAFSYALGIVLVRKHIEKSGVLSIAFVMSIAGGAFLSPLAFLLAPSSCFCTYGLALFIFAGFLHPGLSRLLYFKGVEKIGAAVNASIFASYPVFSTLFASVMLNEEITYKVLIGVVFVALGAMIVETSIHDNKMKFSVNKGLVYPAINAVLVGFAYVVKKLGLNAWNAPIMATATAFITMIGFYLLSIVATSVFSRNTMSAKVSKSSFTLFWKPGVILALASLLSFYALTYGNVTEVVPLIQIEPLFIFVLIRYYLKGIERITFKLLAGTILIIAGAVIVSL